MTDIATFLRARLDEDEAWARAASQPYEYADEGSKAPEGGVHWQWVAGENWEPTKPDPALNEFVAEPGYNCNLVTVEEWTVTSVLTNGQNLTRTTRRAMAHQIVEMDAAAAGHIIRHDPARVLEEVEAKRRIVDEYEKAMAARKAHPGDMANTGRLLMMVGVLTLLALPHADHRDYQPIWGA